MIILREQVSNFDIAKNPIKILQSKSPTFNFLNKLRAGLGVKYKINPKQKCKTLVQVTISHPDICSPAVCSVLAQQMQITLNLNSPIVSTVSCSTLPSYCSDNWASHHKMIASKSFLWLIDELLHYTRRIHHLDGMNVIWNKNFDEYKLWLSIFHKYPDYNPIESGQKLPVKLSLTVRIISFFLLNFFITKFIRILKRYWNVPVLKQSLTNYTKYNIKSIASFYPLQSLQHIVQNEEWDCCLDSSVCSFSLQHFDNKYRLWRKNSKIKLLFALEQHSMVLIFQCEVHIVSTFLFWVLRLHYVDPGMSSKIPFMILEISELCPFLSSLHVILTHNKQAVLSWLPEPSSLNWISFQFWASCRSW